MKNKLFFLGLLIIIGFSFFITSCGQTVNLNDVQSRITAVENGLLPSYYKTGTTPAGMSLTDRMAHYYTPAVSIAVINNGRIEWAKGYGATADNLPVSVEAAPGSAYSYSGGGMEILHQMIEDITGTPFKDYMNDHLLSKIGMTSSAFLQPISGSLLARAVSAHDYSGNLVSGGWNTYPELAAAGLWTNPSDLARIIIEVQQAATGNGMVLSKATAGARS
ncbi:MAG: serine hydrolase domain-containing protein [Candidatus Margulisiibacteriota bacterium]